MTRMFVRAPPLAAALTALAGGLTACGHSAPTTLHDLPLVPPAATPPAPYAGPPVRVDAVRLPPAIDRIELLRQTAPGRYAVREFDRWAASPSRLARQTLAEDLALRLPAGVVVAPGAKGGSPAVAVSLDVLSFSSGPAAAGLTATWGRSCGPRGTTRLQGLSLETAPGEPPEALAALLGQAADRIAVALRAAPDLACSGDDPPGAPASGADKAKGTRP